MGASQEALFADLQLANSPDMGRAALSRLIPPDWQPEVLPPTGKPIPIVLNQDRVDQVLGTLMDAYESNQFPYNQDSVRLPQDARHMPKTLQRGTKEHAMFFWNSCYYMRGGIKSVDALKRMSAIYDSRPELFDCEVAAVTPSENIRDVLRTNGLGFQDTVSRHWVINSRRMRKRYDSDPRNIFSGISNYEDCVDAIKNDGKGGGFHGFKEKMVSMITYYLMDEGLIKHFPFPIPVDMHVMRVSIENKLVEFPGVPNGTNLYSEQLLEKLRSLYFSYAKDKGVDPLLLCNAVWLLSESSCGKYPGNVTLEPLGRKNRNGRSTVLVPQKVDVTNRAQREAYESSCRQCPVETTCELSVPGKPYYVLGAMIVRGERTRFPEPSDRYTQVELF